MCDAWEGARGSAYNGGIRAVIAVGLLLAATVLAGGCVVPPPEDYVTKQYDVIAPPDATPRVVADDSYAGNSRLSESFTASADTDLDKHRSNWGKPWTVVSGGSILVESASGRAVPQGSGWQRAVAPIGADSVLDFDSTSELTPLDLSATVMPGANGARLIFGADESGLAYYYVEIPALGSAGTVKVGDSGVSKGESPSVSLDAGVPLQVNLTGGTLTWDSAESRFNWPVNVKLVQNGEEKLSWSPAANTIGVPNDRIANTLVGFEGEADSWFDDMRVTDPLRAKILVPENAPGLRAAVVVIHGGTFGDGSELDMDAWLNDLAARGYVAVSVDYRKQLDMTPTTYAANSHRIHVTATSGTWGLKIDGTTVSGIDVGASPEDVETAINDALGAGGLSVDAWGGTTDPADLWLTWSSPRALPYPEVETEAQGDALVDSYDSLIEQLEASPFCTSPPSWFPPDLLPPLTPGETCLFSSIYNAEYCPVVHGEAFPAVSDECDHGLQRWAQTVIGRPALDDVQAALRWLKNNASTYQVDTSRIFATGESAGGILTGGLAVRPTDHSGGAEDPGGPNGGSDATIAGGAPVAGGWIINGDGTIPPSTAPLSFFQYDVDTPFYWGAVPSMTKKLMSSAWGNNVRTEYNGWCGVGHGENPPDPAFDEMAKFFHTIIDPSSQYAGTRGGISLGTDNQTFDPTTMKGRQQLLGPETGDYTVLTADFDGDGADDVYWHHPDGTCDSLWLSRDSGTLLPTPLLDPTDDNWGELPHQPDGEIIRPPDPDAVPLAGDFLNADGRAEIAWFNPASANMVVWESVDPVPPPGDNQGVFEYGSDSPENLFVARNQPLGGTFDHAIVGNFGDGDGTAGTDDIYLVTYDDSDDKVLYGTSTTSGEPFSGLTMTGNNAFSTTSAPLVAVGNLDADGYDDIVWFAPGAATDHLWYGAGNIAKSESEAFEHQSWSPVNNIARLVVGNFGQGDSGCAACDDIYLFNNVTLGNESGYEFQYLGSTTRAMSYLALGDQFTPTLQNTLEHAVGDFDNDGWDDVLWYGPGAQTDRLDRGQANLSSTAAGAFAEQDLTMGGTLEPHAANLDESGGDDIFWYAKS